MFRQQAKPRGEVEQHLRNLRILGANYLVTGDHGLIEPSFLPVAGRFPREVDFGH